jgi:UPF0176 protein
MQLHNLENKEVLKEWIKNDPTPRTTISFYRYTPIGDVSLFRDKLYLDWSKMGVLGRIYLAPEGINAQFSVPTANLEKFEQYLNGTDSLKNMPLKIAIEDDGKSFYKLDIKIKKQIVADGLDDSSFDTTNVGKHLTAKEWNQAMENKNSLVVDMRNYYESEVGHFENAITPDVDTFREELQTVKEELKNKKDKQVLLYCTGGVRCEKASAFLKSEGFEDVSQLHGGIIDYTRQCKAEEIENKFKGKNFVFDERMGEKITNEIISNCHQCDQPCDDHTNCANDNCHLLFIQCQKCREKYEGCCTSKCQEVIKLPSTKQKELYQGDKYAYNKQIYRSRLRPKLKEICQTN